MELKAQHNYTGTVVDESAHPIAGASITLLKTKTQTRTDREGKFQVSATDLSERLSVSYMGYETRVLALAESKNRNFCYDGCLPVFMQITDGKVHE
ncbi:carboxypeptidase-like regulatory domain-containing protein, partial [Sphingobacterium multivorum]|uniref:carboxypeptidase-like regulatory domain-containing protein n=1 Tax=Sphingobacterium multivorum TaxID=28454 RepID=UPI00289BC1C0